MTTIGLFYGSSFGETFRIAEMIKEELVDVNLHNVYDTSTIAIKSYDFLIFGTSTWNYGEMQQNWEELISELDNVDFSNKVVAFFGLGDAVRYPRNFVDGMGTLYEKVVEKGGKAVGKWSIAGYNFTESKAMVNDKFIGLVIDEKNEPQLTKQRVHEWCNILKAEIDKY